MKKFTLLLTLIVHLGFSQNRSGIVNYKVSSSPLPVSISNKKAIQLFEMVSKKFDELNYELIFDQEESLFQLKEMLENDNNNSSLLNQAILMACNQRIYVNSKLKIKLTEEELLGDVFLINDSIVNDWNISATSKKINDYICYKATLSLKKDVINRNKDETVVAWFAPDIPVAFGPIGYSGLPGLIFQIEVNNIVFYVSKIKLNKKVTIEKPTEGIHMSSAEYGDYVDKKIKEYGFEKD